MPCRQGSRVDVLQEASPGGQRDRDCSLVTVTTVRCAAAVSYSDVAVSVDFNYIAEGRNGYPFFQSCLG